MNRAYLYPEICFLSSYIVSGFVSTGLGEGIGIGFRNTERDDKDEKKIEADDKNKNAVVKGWKYWDDLPNKYRKLKIRQNRYKNRRK